MESPVILYQNALAKVERSKKFREQTNAYAIALHARGVPIVFTPKHLAVHLGLEYCRLRAISNGSHAFYYYFLISKKSGGKRRVIAPYPDVKQVQGWIKKNILDKLQVMPCVTGFVSGKSILKNAKPHENKRFILKCDIADFFESIDFWKVYQVFKKIGYTKQLSRTLASLCTSTIDAERLNQFEDEELVSEFRTLCERQIPFLIQGAPTSPELANLVCYRLDRRLLAYAEKHHVVYTRYADDMTFSSDNEDDLPKIGFLKKILRESGFKLNAEKTQLLSAKGRQYITGLLVDGRVRVPSKFKKEIYRHLHFCSKYGGMSHFRKIAPDKFFGKEWLYGKIYFVNAIEPEEAKKMLEIANNVDWLK